jgi:hypothetical protein
MSVTTTISDRLLAWKSRNSESNRWTKLMSDPDNGHDPNNQSSLRPVLTLRHMTASRQTNSQDDVLLEE